MDRPVFPSATRGGAAAPRDGMLHMIVHTGPVLREALAKTTRIP